MLLECVVLGQKEEPIQQCLACKDYFETQKYFKASPECIGRVALIKNSTPIRIENGMFKLTIKLMCCCNHHNLDAFSFCLTLNSSLTEEVALSCRAPLCVKQWRKSNQKKEECIVELQ